MLVALYHGEPEIAKDLLARGPVLDLFEASAAGDVARVRALVAAGADVNAYAGDGFTPLGLAAFFKRPAVVNELLAAGADPRAASRNPMRVAPLHSAVADGCDFAIVRALVEAGGDVNAKQRHGWTPLHGAAFEGDAETVRFLLAHGADPKATNDPGKTAADVARERGHEEVARLLEG